MTESASTAISVLLNSMESLGVLIGIMVARWSGVESLDFADPPAVGSVGGEVAVVVVLFRDDGADDEDTGCLLPDSRRAICVGVLDIITGFVGGFFLAMVKVACCSVSDTCTDCCANTRHACSKDIPASSIPPTERMISSGCNRSLGSTMASS